MFGLLFLNAKVSNFAVLFCPRQCLCFLANFWLFRENCSSDGLLLVALTTLPADKARLGIWKETARCSYALKHENDPGVVVVSAQSCLTLCSPMACSPPGSFVHGMSQARMPFPRPGNLPDAGIKPLSPALAGRLFTPEPPGKPI